MRPFAYLAPKSLDEAAALLGAATRPLAGGTDLVTLMNEGLATPERVVAIRTLLPRGVESHAGSVVIGAATTLAALERDRTIARDYPALAQAAATAASAPLRNMATIGGNLLQRPRCWYFRHPAMACWLKGGSTCFARDGENQRHALFGDSPCVAVHPSDPAVALLAFDARVRIRSGADERVVALGELLREPEEGRRHETTLRDDELVLSVALPTHPGETRSVYLKAMDRAAFSFALVSVAAVARLSDDGQVGHVRIALGGVAPVPRRAEDAERRMLGQRADDALIEAAAESAVAGASPLAHNRYKVPLLRALVRRALAEVTAATPAAPASPR